MARSRTIRRGVPDFDVAIAGAGSAGAAAAAALVATGKRVVVIEAGPNYGALSASWPRELLDPTRFPTTHDWGFEERRERGVALPEPRAKVIGGCSTHNQCAASWPLPAEFDAWSRSVNDPAWSYRRIRPLIDEIEDAADRTSTYRGRGGRVPTRLVPTEELASWQRAFREAALEVGYPELDDFSTPEPPDGVGPFRVNVADGIRWNAAFAFLDPIRGNPSLTILDRTLVDRLRFRGSSAEALVCRSASGDAFEVSSETFVLAAGAYGSPAILMRSGIGPLEHLRSLGIPPIADVPGVGANLHDHPGVAMAFDPSAAALASLDEDLSSGRFHQSQVALRTNKPHLHVLPYHGRASDGSWTFEVLVFAMAPRSRGTVRLVDRQPDSAPWIEFGFLGDQRDRADIQAGLSIVSRIAGALSLRDCATAGTLFTTSSDEMLRKPTGYGHAVGTCAMRNAADSRGRVYGTANVRVADASLIPTIPSTNPNLLIMLIGFLVGRDVALEDD